MDAGLTAVISFLFKLNETERTSLVILHYWSYYVKSYVITLEITMGENPQSDSEVFDNLMGSQFDTNQFEVKPRFGEFEHGLESIFKKMSRRPGRVRRAAGWSAGIALLVAAGSQVISDSKME